MARFATKASWQRHRAIEIVRPRSGLQEPCLHAPEGRRGSYFFKAVRRFEIIKARRRENESSGSFFFRFQSTPSSGSAAAAGSRLRQCPSARKLKASRP